MADPVAAKSGFLCMYMSNHPDTLVSYAKHWAKSKQTITHAQMTSIDTKGMTLSCKTKEGGDSKLDIRVPFDPPLAGYEEVKPRLLAMKVDAEQALGMTRNPQISTFEPPRDWVYTAPPILLLYYTMFAPAGAGPVWEPGFRLRQLVGGDSVVRGFWIFMVTVHALESLYTLSLCRRHRTGFVVGAQYVLYTLVFGFPGWRDLRKRIQAARIESIMKGE
ncbi:hypothetical protein PUNSTDRAFT_121903 [Punctularia strigosozonata HHB-11173 SS5]|uniref:uncharacterized protein n=1 Tax=Punctularia strigosozonata (strain HHB-11173) TaxID=741275 RepID=UPI0004417896|nr:uncharacterized protein PUNSTDRAFT_121903 [Punctularia strigosozonata HHB-11173 SS5]EIN06851.1 hypothetical protein PUNSTDRAFT_121903 [Punctularia strigosozonata HHB-11173 SS5]